MYYIVIVIISYFYLYFKIYHTQFNRSLTFM